MSIATAIEQESLCAAVNNHHRRSMPSPCVEVHMVSDFHFVVALTMIGFRCLCFASLMGDRHIWMAGFRSEMKYSKSTAFRHTL
ncbi:uncharacterized protein DEA37_0005040 [Paragonimus westermani]|uniref:Uncharacterized protein n=1 Tax=Paragonimus westermani TaxID=34504 RepID=A0A5J4NZV1_9TREM|nr:uncharacterized protein DEA37_0005040 [Paragonimus westermani]